MTLPDVAQGDPHVAAHNAERSVLNGLSTLTDTGRLSVNALRRVPYTPNNAYMGVATTDAPTVTTGNATDAAFNESYTIASNTLPAIWPVDAFGKMVIASNTWGAVTSVSATGTVTTFRMMMDGSEMMFFCICGTNFKADLFVDGRPYGSNPITPVATSGFGAYGFQKLVFGSAKPRLIELRMLNGLVAVYTKKPYRIWKPSPSINPKIAVVGDSYVAPTVMSDTVAGGAVDLYLAGAYQKMAAVLGLTSLVTDGLGGTGYINTGPSGKNYAHADRVSWLADVNPDVIIMHGGGTNDLYISESVSNITTAVVNRFTALRAAHPRAKLVFVEGFAPPGFTPQATYNANYTTIRTNVQTALNAANIPVYYLDVATTRPPINGTGYVTATNASGNSDVYVGSDTFHLSVAGNTFVRHVLAPKIAKVLSDDGSLAGTLIL